MIRALAYVWAVPTTVLGLIAAGAAVLTGGRARVEQGVLEVHGGVTRWLLKRAVPIAGGVEAMTLGHVVVARSPEALSRTRAHERVHVRQCEHWGPFFVPAYLAASFWAFFRGRPAYKGNWFERCAFHAVSRDCAADE